MPDAMWWIARRNLANYPALGLGVDLQGGSIDRITLEVRRLSLVPVDAFGTAIDFDVALQVLSAPEPAAELRGLAAAVAFGALFLARRSS